MPCVGICVRIFDDANYLVHQRSSKAICITQDIIYIMLTSDQIRAARALVRWSARELAEKAGISLPTVQRLEAATGVPSTSVQTLLSIKAALEKAGVEFTNGGTPGVRLRPR
jgi:DNA-binding Xre family transcriptional regulator